MDGPFSLEGSREDSNFFQGTTKGGGYHCLKYETDFLSSLPEPQKRKRKFGTEEREREEARNFFIHHSLFSLSLIFLATNHLENKKFSQCQKRTGGVTLADFHSVKLSEWTGILLLTTENIALNLNRMYHG